MPAAGLIAILWLGVGVVLFASFFIKKAEAIEASEQALDPELMRLRGLSPLVMLPISNPANAESMIFLANALAPPVIGRILVHNIVIPSTEKDDLEKRLFSSRDVMQYALKASFEAGLRPETLTTIADHPWEEIERVVKEHNCTSLLLGLSDLNDVQTSQNLEKLVRHIKADVVVFRQPFSGWKITAARKILIPVAGFESNDPLRARVAASLWRASQPEITFIQVLPSTTPSETIKKNNERLSRFAGGIIPGKTEVLIVQNDDSVEELVNQASRHDLVIMGLGNPGKHQKTFGHVAHSLAEKTDSALIFISKK